MYESVHIRGFRQFEDLSIEGFTRVNLLVGKNNSGKTSVLEAMEILSSGSAALAILRVGRRRGEASIPDAEGRRGYQVNVRHLFRGHQLADGMFFDLRDKAERPIAFVHCDVKEVPRDDAQLDLSSQPVDDGPQLALVVTDHHRANEPAVLRLSLQGGTFGESIGRPGTNVTSEAKPLIFLGTSGATGDDLVRAWDRIVLTPEEDNIVAAMQLVEPAIERIAFSTERLRLGDAVVRQNGSEHPVPLGSLGDGTRRMLALSIFLSRASGGVLLVDEIDTGLHYSTLESMWRLVVTTARRLNVQVFATSHSGDCMRALAWLQADDPDLAADVSVHRLEKDARRSVRYSAEDLEIAAQHHIEVRG